MNQREFTKRVEELVPDKDFSEDYSKIPRNWYRLCIGLGDVIAFSGAVIWSLDKFGPTVYPCNDIYLDSVKSFFVNYPEVKVLTLRQCLTDDRDPDEMIPFGIKTVMAIEPTRPMHSRREMYEECYRELKVPYSARWDCCPIAQAAKSVAQRTIPEVPYAFLHFKKANPIDRARIGEGLEIAAPTHFEGESILAYADAIEQATEVHVINSSFWWLTEHLKPKGKLFAHWAARDFLPIWQNYLHRQKWEFFL